MAEASITLRVRYAETDRMGVAYYGNYFTWFEVGRVELLRQLGFRYRDLEEQENSYIVVAEARCHYRRPARFDDLLRVVTRVVESRSRSIRFAYEIYNEETGELLATGETTHVICDANGRPRVLPEKYRKYFPLTNAPAPDARP